MSVMTPILTTPSEIRYADCPGLAESAACACGSAHAFANAISKAAPSARIIASRRHAQRLVFDDCSLAPFKPRPLCQTIKEWQAMIFCVKQPRVARIGRRSRLTSIGLRRPVEIQGKVEVQARSSL